MSRKNMIEMNIVSNKTRNRNSFLKYTETNNGELRTETYNRDEGTASFAITTNASSKASSLYIDLPDGSIRLSGSEARTLYRLLNKHYTNAGMSA